MPSRRSGLSLAGILLTTVAGLAWSVSVPAAPGPPQAAHPAANPQIEMKIEGRGTVLIDLLPKDASKTVAHIMDLVHHKFYDGIRFHRVRPGFMAQTGAPESRKFTAAQLAGKSDQQLGEMGVGVGGSGHPVPLEVATGRTHERGSLGMAREGQDPNSGDSQFFISFVPNHRLDGGYTVFGKVVKGMNVVDKIQQGDRIVSLREVKKGAASGRR